MLKTAKKFNSTCSLHIIHPQLLKRNIYFCIYVVWSLKVKYLCKCNMYFCKNTSLLTGGYSTHITSAGAWTCIGRYDTRFLKVSGACQTSYDAQPGTVGIVRFEFKKNRTVPVRCVQTPGAVRCPADVILPSMTLPNAVRAPWNF